MSEPVNSAPNDSARIGAKPVLVTGGAGYIGAHICKALAQHGYCPIAYDDLSNGSATAVKWGPLIEGRLQDSDRLAYAFISQRPIAVVHCAGSIEAGTSVADPLPFYANNVGGTLALLEVMAAQSVKHIVFSSTAAVYGEPKTSPIPESHPLKPVNPYGHSKMMAEQIIRDAAAGFGLNHIILRYFNAAGADPDGEIGEQHDPETHLIPLALQAAAGKRDKVMIFGTDYDTPDGTCIRDYVHVSDLAHTHVAALRYLFSDAAKNLTVNLGAGQGHSIYDVLAAITRITGRHVPHEVKQRRPGDAAQLIADQRLAARIFGPEIIQHSALETIIKTAWDWQK